METFDKYALEMQLANGQWLYVGSVPGRKKIALGIQEGLDGCTIDVVAYFRDAEAANRFVDMIKVGSVYGEG